MISILSYFHHSNFIKVFLGLDRLQIIIYKEFLLLRWSPHFSAFELPNSSLSKKYMLFHWDLTPPTHETNLGDTWTQPLVTNFYSFIPHQYESNPQKQDLLITTGKISQCLLWLQMVKVIKFCLKSFYDYKFHALTIQAHPHTPLPKHIFFFFTAWGWSKKNFSVPGVT